VFREEVVDEGLVAKPTPLGLAPHGLENLGINPNRNESPGRRPQGGPHCMCISWAPRVHPGVPDRNIRAGPRKVRETPSSHLGALGQSGESIAAGPATLDLVDLPSL